MTTIKVGDCVERITERYKGMSKGDKDIVIFVHHEYTTPSLELKKYGGGHAHYNFKVISIDNWRQILE